MNAETDKTPQAPTRMSTLQLRDAKTIGEALQTVQFQRAVTEAAPQHITANRLMATFRQAARNKPEFNQCSLASVLGVFMTCSFLGLEPNTPQGHAYMIPFAKKRWDKAARQLVDDGYDLQLIIGYQGYLDLAYRSPRVSSIAAHAVYEGDDFSFEYGSNEHLQHRPKGLHAEDDLPRYFYMFAKLQQGQSFEVLPTSRVLRIRNASQGFRAAEAARDNAVQKGWKIPASYTEAPWVKHFTAMGQKTALRAGYKWLPKTVEMAAVERLEDAQDRGTIDFGPVLEGQVNPLEEDLPMVTEPRADPGAAFGQRGQDEDGGPPTPTQAELDQQEATRQSAHRQMGGDPPPPAAQPPTQRETKPAAPTPPTNPPPAAQAAPSATPQGFAAYLADASGEIVERFGDAGYVTDAVVYAAAYAEVWIATPPANRVALAEHNADGLADARQEAPKAAQILDALADAPAPAAGSGPITVQVTNGRPDLKGYLDALRTAAAAQTADSFPAWQELQRSVITTISTVTRKAAEKIVADRATALGTTKPPAPSAPSSPPPPAEQAAQPAAANDPPPPTGNDAPGDEPGSGDDGGLLGDPLPPAAWSRAAQDMVDNLRQCTDMHSLEILANNAATKVAFRKIAEADADEGKRLQAYAVQRRAELSAPRA